MFGFSKKIKNVNNAEVKAFDWAVRAIEIYIALSEWAKAKKAIEEIMIKEKESLTNYIEKVYREQGDVEAEKIKAEETKKFAKKEAQIKKLKEKATKLEAKYIEKIEKDRFQIRFKKIKDEIDTLIWKRKSVQAMWILQKFLEENKENSIVIKFYNAQKKKIQLNIEKQRKLEQDKIRSNARMEALNLIGETTNLDEEKNNKKDDKKNLAKDLFKKLNFYKSLKNKIKRKKLLDEINLLIEEDNKANDEIAERKLESIHKWLVKEISKNKMTGYDLYWKILWADKISGDTFWIEETWDKYKFFIWDATGRWIKAGFVITMLTRLFKDNIKKDLRDIVLNVNNGLKQDLKSRNFITWIFFEVDKKSNDLWYVWMGHEPILVYRAKENKVEKIVPGWLATWIRIIKDSNDIKVKNIQLDDWDIVITYSDWVVENKNLEWESYWIDRLIQNFKLVAENEKRPRVIYDYLINDLKLYGGWSHFWDDATLIILRRDSTKDIVSEEDKYLEDLKAKEWLDNKEVKKLKWKTKKEIEKELEEIRKAKEIKRILKVLENLYYTWEVLKLKEEAIRFIKKWYIHKKINFYLRKAIENEKKYKIEQKNQKMQNKYNVLKELYKKWDYTTVINEVEEIIAKDGNI